MRMKPASVLLLLSMHCFSANADNARNFRAPSWLPTGHLQTIYPAKFADTFEVQYRRERWELPDGDFIDTDWLDDAGQEKSAQTPLVVLFHGLEGNSRSHYAKSLMAAVEKKGWRGAVMHFRGCSGENNRLPRAYYAGDSVEMQNMLTWIKQAAPEAPVFAIGVSLGGNALLKWLGESGGSANDLLRAAAAVSAPVDLAACANALDTGLNRLLYVPTFLPSLRTKALQKARKFPDLLDLEKVSQASTFRAFDTYVTARLHGFKGADDYWAKNSAKPWLKSIKTPTLMLNAENDPFIPASSLPASSAVSEAVTLEVTQAGGHVGFTSAISQDGTWLPQHLLHYFEQTLATPSK